MFIGLSFAKLVPDTEEFPGSGRQTVYEQRGGVKR
jgi:hypothetical protein